MTTRYEKTLSGLAFLLDENQAKLNRANSLHAAFQMLKSHYESRPLDLTLDPSEVKEQSAKRISEVGFYKTRMPEHPLLPTSVESMRAEISAYMEQLTRYEDKYVSPLVNGKLLTERFARHDDLKNIFEREFATSLAAADIDIAKEQIMSFQQDVNRDVGLCNLLAMSMDVTPWQQQRSELRDYAQLLQCRHEVLEKYAVARNVVIIPMPYKNEDGTLSSRLPVKILDHHRQVYYFRKFALGETEFSDLTDPQETPFLQTEKFDPFARFITTLDNKGLFLPSAPLLRCTPWASSLTGSTLYFTNKFPSRVEVQMHHKSFRNYTLNTRWAPESTGQSIRLNPLDHQPNIAYAIAYSVHQYEGHTELKPGVKNLKQVISQLGPQEEILLLQSLNADGALSYHPVDTKHFLGQTVVAGTHSAKVISRLLKEDLQATGSYPKTF